MVSSRVRATAALTVGLLIGLGSSVSAQECRYQCGQDFEACKRGCVDAQSFDNCVDDCRESYDDCLSSCR